MALGIGLLTLLSVDVFLTVFQAQGKPGPVTRVQNKLVWWVFRRVGVRGGDRVQAGVLSLAAPTMVIVTLFSWVVLLTFGYALIYYEWMSGFLVTDGRLRAPWIEALYYSGYTAATLGFGDLIPDAEAFRLLAPVQAFCGFALVSVSITYLLATYRELITMRTTAMKIATYFRASDIHSPEFKRSGGFEATTRWADRTSELLMHAIQAHFQYPILHYFRPANPDWSLPVQLGRLFDLRFSAREAGSSEITPLTSTDPSFLVLFEALDDYLSEVGHHFVPQVARDRTRGGGDGTAGEADGAGGKGDGTGGEDYGIDGDTSDSRRTHDRLLRYMAYR